MSGDSSLTISDGHVVLPKNVKPTHYNLTIEPDLETLKYSGKVVIDLDVLQDTKSIALNTIDLNITDTQVYVGSKRIATVSELHHDSDTQTTTTTLQETISSGSKATLTHTFDSTISEKLAGFYRAQYTAKDGSKKYIGTTQMEPTDARRAFPCFDEPALKAHFTITLITEKGLTCLSNMDVASTKDVKSEMSGTTKQAVTFNPTPLMSTYLLAFIVGEFNVIENNDFRVPVRVYATPDKDIEHGHFSMQLAARVLEFYEKKFDSPYPLPKLDMVAVPDFSAGAMENWGLVTYRVVDLLFDEKTAAISTKVRIAEVVAHELAHQWFGNLVTMDFWEGLWLNEGFATWMSWYSCNAFFPEWKVWQSYITNDYSYAVSLDSLRSSHPVEVPLKRADEVDQIFDAISYSKGSCVLRMVSRYLGEETFLSGVRHYLAKHAYGNTKTDDLWSALAHVSGKDVEKLMDVWTRKIGFPVVTVSEDEASNTLTVKQNRYLKTGDVKSSEDETIYPVVLGIRTKSGIDNSHVLEGRDMSFKVNDMGFYKLNADHAGIFRTSYPPSRLAKLGEAAKSGLLSVEDRAGMIEDASALAASGNQRTSSVLALLKGFTAETEVVVWESISTVLSNIKNCWIFEDQNVVDALDKYRLDLLRQKTHELGWDISENDSYQERELKALLFSTAGFAGDEKIRKAAFDMFGRLRKGDKSAVHPDLRIAVYQLVLYYGGEPEFEAVLNEYRTASTAIERDSALRCIGRTQDNALIKRTLEFPLSPEVRMGECFQPLLGLRGHRAGIEAMWPWMTTQWDVLNEKYRQAPTIFSTFIQICATGFTSEQKAREVEAFFANKDTKDFDMKLAQTLEAVRAKAGWLKRDREDVKMWLTEQGYMK